MPAGKRARGRSGALSSRSEDMGPDGVPGTNFFASRKNLVGLTLAVLVIILHFFVFNLGALWFVAAAAAWGAGVVLTPAPKPQSQALPPAPEVPQQVKLEDDLKASLRKLHRADAPKPVMNQARELENNLRFVLAEWDDLDSSPDHQMNVWNIVEIYLPQVVDTYLDAPQFRSDEAVAAMTDSLETLTGAAARIKNGILDHNLRALDSNARTLRETFGNLPGLDQS